jgi:hypothetical protein
MSEICRLVCNGKTCQGRKNCFIMFSDEKSCCVNKCPNCDYVSYVCPHKGCQVQYKTQIYLDYGHFPHHYQDSFIDGATHKHIEFSLPRKCSYCSDIIDNFRKLRRHESQHFWNIVRSDFPSMIHSDTSSDTVKEHSK